MLRTCLGCWELSVGRAHLCLRYDRISVTASCAETAPAEVLQWEMELREEMGMSSDSCALGLGAWVQGGLGLEGPEKKPAVSRS